MNKVKRKFIFYAEMAVFVLLTVLLSVINAINFTMASEDADRITEMISKSGGTFFRDDSNAAITPGGRGNSRIGPMGPDSPEMNASVRYFTYAFDEDGNAEKIDYRISAVTESEAERWAESLLNEDIGWTNVTYRYRVYEKNDKTYVTVIDQGRELLPSYRILIISLCGEAAVLLLSFLILVLVGKSLFNQFEEADRKQKRFIANVESEFKLPLTIINANTEVIERENGSNDQTKSINRQVRKMTKLVKNLAALSIFEEKDITVSKVDMSNIFNVAIDTKKSKFEKHNIELEYSIDTDITVDGDERAIKQIFDELIENSIKFSVSKASFTLQKQNGRIVIQQTNDTNLSNGSIDQIFDRFTTLENANDKDGYGLGLSYVKDIVKAHNGRISAKVSGGIFTLRIDM